MLPTCLRRAHGVFYVLHVASRVTKTQGDSESPVSLLPGMGANILFFMARFSERGYEPDMEKGTFFTAFRFVVFRFVVLLDCDPGFTVQSKCSHSTVCQATLVVHWFFLGCRGQALPEGGSIALRRCVVAESPGSCDNGIWERCGSTISSLPKWEKQSLCAAC